MIDLKEEQEDEQNNIQLKKAVRHLPFKSSKKTDDYSVQNLASTPAAAAAAAGRSAGGVVSSVSGYDEEENQRQRRVGPDGSSRSNSTNRLPAEDVLGERTMYERALRMVHRDSAYRREVELGRRVGLYRIGREIGSGNFSKVREATHSLLKEKVAVKMVKKEKLDSRGTVLLQREIDALSKPPDHPSIIRLFEVSEDFARLYLFMEYANGGDLHNRITSTGKLTTENAKYVFAQLLSAIIHLHSHNIFHRDIKAENVFFLSPNEHRIKLGDFGFAVQVQNHDQHLVTYCGSPPYAAPELFEDNFYLGGLSDIWSLGVVLYFMSTAYHPFRGDSLPEIRAVVCKGEYDVPDWMDHGCISLISSLLILEPQRRLPLDAVAEHAYLRGVAENRLIGGRIRYSPSSTSSAVDGGGWQQSDGDFDRIKDKLKKYGITVEMCVKKTKEGGGIREPLTGITQILLHEASLATTPSSPTALEAQSSAGNVRNRSPSSRIIAKSPNKSITKISSKKPIRLSKICVIL